MALGAYPEVTLKKARRKREDARRLLDDGRDPSLEKQIQKQVSYDSYHNNLEAVRTYALTARLEI